MNINPWSGIMFGKTMHLESKCLNLIPGKCSKTDNVVQNYEIAYKK